MRRATRLRVRADENGAVGRLGNRRSSDERLVTRQIYHWRERVEPVFSPVDDEEWLHALATTRNEVVIFLGIQRQGQRPLAQVAEALGRSCFSFGVRQSGQEQTGQNRDDDDDHQQFGQCECGPPLRPIPHFLPRAHRQAQNKANPSPLSANAPGSGTATIVRTGRLATVPKLLELNTPLTVLSGFLETMRELPLNDAERARYLELMEQQASRMQIELDLCVLYKWQFAL